MDIELSSVGFSYEERKILSDIDMHVKNKSFVGVIGPNGSGKSTLLKQVYRALEPEQGEIWADGKILRQMSYRESAKEIGVVGQEHEMPFDFQTWEIVAMGRSPHKKLFEQESEEDREIVRGALKKLHIEQLANQNYQHLSGGEKQRVLIARMLAQQTEMIILDEPTNHLDVRYQMEIFQMISQMDVTVLAAVHDLNIAAMYCDWIYILKDGKLCGAGAPEEVFTPDMIYKIYGIRADVFTHELTGKKHITYLPPEL